MHRGRLSNHLYLQLVGDGDPHTLIRPDTIRPSTATELLEQILARDNAPRSANTLLRDQHDPAQRLGHSVESYIDALHVAAEGIVGTTAAQALETSANQLVPGLTDEPAWPTLRAHLLLLSMNGADPHARLRAACDIKELISADDRAAVLDWRLDDTSLRGRGGPLPWLPGIPDRIAADPKWGPYLDARSDLVAQLAGQVRLNVGGEAPAWAAQLRALVSAELIADMQVWRAATQVDPNDLRPTGPPQLGYATRIFQQRLDIATRRCGYQRRLAMAAPARHRSPQRHRRPIPAGAGGKTDESRPGRLRRRPPRAVGGRRRTPTRRPPRSSPLVAHPRSATASAEPGPRNPQRRPSDQTHNHDVTPPAATQAALGTASRGRPEPLKPRLPTHHDA